MDPLTNLHVAQQRRTEYERRACEYRLARSLTDRPRPTIPFRRRSTPVVGHLNCCPA